MSKLKKDITIILKYKINKRGRKKNISINIFGQKFVLNNKNNCELFFKNQKHEFTSKFEITNELKKLKNLEIKLKISDDISNLSFMFQNCSSLYYISDDFAKINIANVIDISQLFENCKLLSKLPEISKWDISNVKNTHALFRGCINLSQLPDISKWKTSNVTNMRNLFRKCRLLKSLPDISNWDTSNVVTIRAIFCDCKSLITLPDISNWNISNVEDMNYSFYGCDSLKKLPDISKWNIEKVKNMNGLFYGCSSLIELPDISKWNPINAIDLGNLFFRCKNLKNIPNIYNWNLMKANTLYGLFDECNSLVSFPDFSKFKNINREFVNVVNNTFVNRKDYDPYCNESFSIPDAIEENSQEDSSIEDLRLEFLSVDKNIDESINQQQFSHLDNNNKNTSETIKGRISGYISFVDNLNNKNEINNSTFYK